MIHLTANKVTVKALKNDSREIDGNNVKLITEGKEYDVVGTQSIKGKSKDGGPDKMYDSLLIVNDQQKISSIFPSNCKIVKYE